MYMAAFCISQLREKEIIQRSGYLLLTMDGGEGFVFLNTKKEKVDHSSANGQIQIMKRFITLLDHSSEGRRKLFQRNSKTLLGVPF